MFYLLALIFSVASLSAEWNGKFFSPERMEIVPTSDVLNLVKPDTVTIFGEAHDSELEHQRQVEFLSQVKELNPTLKISVAMEFLEYPDQKKVDYFLQGILSELEFLKLIEWGNNPYEYYRKQVLFPQRTGGRTFAVNLPRKISQKISKLGISGLSETEKSFLPSGFEMGNELYRERFEAAMGGHGTLPPEKIARYFESQSAWDDTMASKINEAMIDRSQALVMIVGRFHAEYGGGLPDRMIKRGMPKPLVITQMDVSSLTPRDILDTLKANPKYGIVSDLVWLIGEPKGL